MKKLLLSLLVVLFFFMSCEMILNFENPLDPDSLSYQGFETVENVNQIQRLFLEESDTYSVSIGVTPCDGASEYEFQFSLNEDFSNAFTVQSSSNLPEIDAGLFEQGDWFWRGRARQGENEWGNWTDSAGFHLDSPIVGLNFGQIDSTSNLIPVFSWNSSEDVAQYELQIGPSRQGLLSTDIIVINDTQYFPNVALSNNSTYYWRMRTLTSNRDYTPWTSIRELTISWGAITGKAPVDDFHGIDNTPSFFWDEISGADHYEFQIANNQDDLNESTIITVNSIPYIHDDFLEVDTYFWRVRAVGDQNQVGLWSSVNTITIDPILSMIEISGGTFTMGDTWNTGDNSEKPIHDVTLSSFFMADKEVTFEQFEQVRGWALSNGYSTFTQTGTSGSDNFIDDAHEQPVVNISYLQAILWCNALSEYQNLEPVYYSGDNSNKHILRDLSSLTTEPLSVSGVANGYRLPTEAEWEYAARGGNNDNQLGEYSGSSYINNVSWNRENSDLRSHAVGSKDPNELGLFDMTGNVWEYCWDDYKEYYSITQTNPASFNPSGGVNKVKRGGSWDDVVDSCRISYRTSQDDEATDNMTGFRAVRYDNPRYYIWFTSNDDLWNLQVQWMHQGMTANFNENIFTRDGYRFTGWATSINGAVLYTDGVEYTMDSSDLTLYAVWELE